ncbi:MAG: cyclic nucleotide-binding domain-containing protein [Anaerolineales bacterium]|nr:MAG: cyclic nucleotide-binding domain-containing protein [Anaerolineales bacterium]
MIAPEIIASFSSFSSLEEDEIKAMAILAEERRYATGEFIFREGGQASNMYLLLEGRVELMMNTNADGDQHAVVMTVGPDEVFGWSSLVEPYELTASARCAVPVRVVALAASGMRALMTMKCSLGFRMMQKACQTASARLRATREQLLSTVRPLTEP